MTDDARSGEACPECGAHRLALLGFPHGPAVDDQTVVAVFGTTEAHAEEAPAIGCLACGAEWPDLESFRAAQQGQQQRP